MPANTKANSVLLTNLKKDYSYVHYLPGNDFVWSPKLKKIEYLENALSSDIGKWALIHETAHAELGHTSFDDDFSLLQLEVAAWSQAKIIARNYGLKIDSEHIEDCLDTYRDWLHNRSTCPKCGVVSLQGKNNIYTCFNCSTSWKVPKSQVCRVVRRVIKK